MEKTPQPLPEMQEQEAPPVPSPAINFAEPVSPTDLTAQVEDAAPVKSEPVFAVIPPAEMEAIRKEAEREDVKRDFTKKVLAARTQPEPEYVMPPVAPRIHKQTNAELEAGRAAVAKAAEHHAQRPHRVPEEPTGVKAVFRPADYVPDQKKGQGRVQVRPL